MAPRLAKLPSVVGLLITDDGVDLAANEVAEIEWMRTHTPELWPWVNQCGDGTDWLARAGTPYAVPELYAVPGRPLNASEVVKAAAAQLGGYDHWLSESERFGLLHFPLNIGDGGDTGLVRSTSLVRFQAYAALAYGAKGLNRGTAGATARGTSPPTRRRPSTPSSKKLTSASTLVAGRRRCWRRPGRARSTRDGAGPVASSWPPTAGALVEAMDDNLLAGVLLLEQTHSRDAPRCQAHGKHRREHERPAARR